MYFVLAIHTQRFWPKQSSEPITEPAGLPVPRPKQWPTMILKPSGPSFSHSGSRSFISFSPMGGWAKVGINPHFRCSILCSQAKHNPSSFDGLYVQKRALELVESSRDPNMLTKIQELARQVLCVFFPTHVAFFLQGGLFNCPPPKMSKCWPVSKFFQKKIEYPDCPPLKSLSVRLVRKIPTKA